MKRERVDEQKRNGEKWRVAIEEYAVRPASSFQGNPRNWRKHPEAQRNAVAGSLRELGFIAPVIENRRTGHLIDGHERVWQALQHGDDTPVPVVVVDLPEEREHLALTIFDPITGMAEADKELLASLMDDVRTGDAALQAMMEQLAEDEGLIVPEGEFPEYTEDAANGVKTAKCPECGHEFPI